MHPREALMKPDAGAAKEIFVRARKKRTAILNTNTTRRLEYSRTDASDSCWPQVLDRAQNYLDTIPHELTMHMDYNTVYSCAFDGSPRTFLDYEVTG